MIALVLSTLLAAPTAPQDGNLADIPIFLTATGSEHDSCEILVCNRAAQEATPVVDENPTYGRALMFPTGTATSNVKLASFSRGLSLIPLNWDSGDPYFDAAQRQWTFLIYGVAVGTTGGTAGIYPLQNPESNLYAYQDGVKLPPDLSDRADLIRSGTNMGVSSVIGCDSYAYNRLLGPDTKEEGDLDIYFSVDAATTAGSGLVESSIYTMHYDAGNNVWGPITTYLNCTALQIAEDSQIDALCVDAERGIALISLAAQFDSSHGPLDHELWLYWDNTADSLDPISRGPLKLPNDALFVVEKLDFDLPTDGVTALCADDPVEPILDPSEPPLLSDDRHYLRSLTSAFPRPDTPLVNTAINLSCHRRYRKPNGVREDVYQLNVRLTDHPMPGMPVSTYTVEFQEFDYAENEWAHLKTKTLNYGPNARVFAVRPWTMSNIPFLEPISFRALVYHPSVAAPIHSHEFSFYY